MTPDQLNERVDEILALAAGGLGLAKEIRERFGVPSEDPKHPPQGTERTPVSPGILTFEKNE